MTCKRHDYGGNARRCHKCGKVKPKNGRPAAAVSPRANGIPSRALASLAPQSPREGSDATAAPPTATPPAAAQPERPEVVTSRTDDDLAQLEEDKKKKIKLRKMQDYLGRRLFNLTEALTDKTITWIGREPPEADPDEEELIGEGFSEQVAIWFGDVELSPAGKIGLGTACMAVGKWASGKPIPKPEKKAELISLPRTEGTTDGGEGK